MRFTQDELFDESVAPPGTYLAKIWAVRESTSRRGNPMIVVVLRLQGRPGADRVVEDYFVLDGASSRALAIARRRLLALCRACGLEPTPDVDLDLQRLNSRPVEVDVDTQQGDTGLRNVPLRYRPAPTSDA